jgi:hypothetical protein
MSRALGDLYLLWVFWRHAQPNGMSASPLKADIRASGQHVCFGPEAEVADPHFIAAKVSATARLFTLIKPMLG